MTPTLSGENYHVWALKIRRVLATMNKFKYVDRLIEVAKKNDLNFAAWESDANNLVYSWIIKDY